MRNLYIIAESTTDVQILRTVLDCSAYNNVFNYGTSGYRNMSNVCRTLRLMLDNNDKILIAFNTDTKNQEMIDDLQSMMIYLTKADVSQVDIGIFPMAPDFNTIFGINEDVKKNIDKLKSVIREIIGRMRGVPVIVEMQSFLNQ